MLKPLKIFKRTLTKKKAMLQGDKCTFFIAWMQNRTSLANYIMPYMMHFFDVISSFYCK